MYVVWCDQLRDHAFEIAKLYSTDHKQLNIYSCVLAKSLRVRIEYS